MSDLNRTVLVAVTGAAWLSSACAVKCTVNSGNMRNPHPKLLFLGKLPPIRRRKVGMTSNQHGPYALGDTRATMGSTKGSQAVTRSKSLKTPLSSDWGLQLDLMKLESLVTADQPRRGEYVLGSCTHRPSRQGSRQYPNADVHRQKVGLVTGTKS